MNGQTRSPFLVLLKHELGARQTSGVELFLALTFFHLPWLALGIGMFALGCDLTAFYPGMLGGLLLFWLLGVCGLATYPQVPLVWNSMANFKAFEFLFTRAVDRRLSFRAKAAAALICVLAPQLPGLLWSAVQPDMVVSFDVRPPVEASALAPGEPVADTIQGQVFPTARYLQAFPGSERLSPAKPEEGAGLRIRLGWLTYAWWLAWGSTLLTAHLFAYYALVGRHLRSTGWWANTVLITPVPVLMGALLFAVWRGFNPGDELLLGFREHWFVCAGALAAFSYGSLRWCERRFAELEIA